MCGYIAESEETCMWILENLFLAIAAVFMVYALTCGAATVFCRDSIKQLVKEYFESHKGQDKSCNVERKLYNEVIKIDGPHTLKIVFQKGNGIFSDDVPVAKITLYPSEDHDQQ